VVAVIGHVSDGMNPLSKDSPKGDGLPTKLMLPQSTTGTSSMVEGRVPAYPKVNNSNVTISNSSNNSSNNGSTIDPDAEETARVLERQRLGLPWIDKAASPNVSIEFFVINFQIT
jgi:hypothetical protein